MFLLFVPRLRFVNITLSIHMNHFLHLQRTLRILRNYSSQCSLQWNVDAYPILQIWKLRDKSQEVSYHSKDEKVVTTFWTAITFLLLIRFFPWTLRYKKEIGEKFRLCDVFKGKKKLHTFLTAVQLQVKNLTACRVLIRAHYNLIDLHWQ